MLNSFFDVGKGRGKLPRSFLFALSGKTGINLLWRFPEKNLVKSLTKPRGSAILSMKTARLRYFGGAKAVRTGG